MPTPLLSVVMPTHNRPGQLADAAASVLDQAGVDIELVIVDDASDDHTPEVTDRLAEDRRVRVLRNATSLGPGGARNAGIAAATGDLLGFCDDDDAWLPGAAATLVGRLEEDPALGVVTSWHRVVHDRTGRIVEYRGPTDFGADELLWFNFVALPFGVVRRSAFPDLAFDESLPPCEDWDLWLRCAQRRPLAVVPQVLYSYLQHGGDRVTAAGSGERGGRQAFLDKHSWAMSPSCRAYHRAVIADRGDRGRSTLASVGTTGARTPLAAGFAGAMLATTFATSHLGMRRRDPGLAPRSMCRLLATGLGRGPHVEPEVGR